MIAGPAHAWSRTSSAPASITTRPSIMRGLVDLAVAAGLERLEHAAVALEQRILLAGVEPPALEHVVAHPVALVDQPLDGVGDLQLAARARARWPRTASWIVGVNR